MTYCSCSTGTHSSPLNFLILIVFEDLRIPEKDAIIYAKELMLLGYDDPKSISDIDINECFDFMKPGHRKRFERFLLETLRPERFQESIISDLSTSSSPVACDEKDLTANSLMLLPDQKPILKTKSMYAVDANVILKQIGSGNSSKVHQSLFVPTLSLLAMKMVFTRSVNIAKRLVEAELKVLNRLSKHSLMKNVPRDDFVQFESGNGCMELSDDEKSDEVKLVDDDISDNSADEPNERSYQVDSSITAPETDVEQMEQESVNEVVKQWLAAASVNADIMSTTNVDAEPQREMVGHQSDYIVKFYDAYYDPTKEGVCLVMEYMSRGSLADLMKKGVIFSESMVAVVAYSILMALVDLHCLHMVHRDIKPENILCSAEGRVKLADFGITGEVLTTFDYRVTFTGTAMYMSPERIKGDPYSFPSDVWGLGVSLLTLIKGSPPFSATRSFWSLTEEICTGAFPELNSDSYAVLHSPEMVDFLRSCLHINADQRSSAAELLQHPFIQNAINSGVISPPHPPCLQNLPVECDITEKQLMKIVGHITKWRVDHYVMQSHSDYTRRSHTSSAFLTVPVAEDVMSFWNTDSVLRFARDLGVDLDNLTATISSSVHDALEYQQAQSHCEFRGKEAQPRSGGEPEGRRSSNFKIKHRIDSPIEGTCGSIEQHIMPTMSFGRPPPLPRKFLESCPHADDLRSSTISSNSKHSRKHSSTSCFPFQLQGILDSDSEEDVDDDLTPCNMRGGRSIVSPRYEPSSWAHSQGATEKVIQEELDSDLEEDRGEDAHWDGHWLDLKARGIGLHCGSEVTVKMSADPVVAICPNALALAVTDTSIAAPSLLVAGEGSNAHMPPSDDEVGVTLANRIQHNAEKGNPAFSPGHTIRKMDDYGLGYDF